MKITEKEWIKIDLLIKLLTPVATTTENIQSETSPTISMKSTLVKLTLDEIERVDTSSNEEMRILQGNLKYSILYRTGAKQMTEFEFIAALLDCRSWKQAKQRTDTKSTILKLIQNNVTEETGPPTILPAKRKIVLPTPSSKSFLSITKRLCLNETTKDSEQVK